MGITYTSLLSGSLLGIIAMIAALAVVFAICSGVVWLAGADVRKSIRRSGRAILIFWVIAILIFPSILAFMQAGQVKKGNEKYFGGQFGIFGYRAQLVSISPTSNDMQQVINDVKQVIRAPVNKCYPRIFLLGQNSQYVILYLSVDRRTVHVPTSLVIVKSPPYRPPCANP